MDADCVYRRESVKRTPLTIIIGFILGFCCTTICRSCQAKDIYKIAVIDSGLDPAMKVNRCPSGDKDFNTGLSSVTQDYGGARYNYNHGSFVADTIKSQIHSKNYCVIAYAVFPIAERRPEIIGLAVREAIKEGVDAINISIVGPEADYTEEIAIKEASKAGIRVFVGAGNDHANLNTACFYFPACYKGISNLYPVGGYKACGNWICVDDSSNYGLPVRIWEPYDYYGRKGTSFSTAIATGKYINYLIHKGE